VSVKRLDSRLSSWSVSWKRRSADFHSETRALALVEGVAGGEVPRKS
jgi:hypothetical protein